MLYKVISEEIHSYVFDLPDDLDDDQIDDLISLWPDDLIVYKECHDFMTIEEYKCDENYLPIDE